MRSCNDEQQRESRCHEPETSYALRCGVHALVLSVVVRDCTHQGGKADAKISSGEAVASASRIALSDATGETEPAASTAAPARGRVLGLWRWRAYYGGESITTGSPLVRLHSIPDTSRSPAECGPNDEPDEARGRQQPDVCAVRAESIATRRGLS